MDEMTENTTYDVLVVGGGAAGLSGALALGRARRSVLVVDAGEPRNAPAEHIHNYLGHDGTSPAELLSVGRAEVARYGVEVVTGTATAAERTTHGFAVRLGDGRQVQARRLLVTTGLVDELPAIPGVAEGWGHDVLHCPYCHGWEVRDRALGVLASNAHATHQALLFRQWSDDVTVFLHNGPAPSADEREQLDARGIRLVEGTVTGWEAGGVRLATGDLVPRDALVVAPVFTARADLLVSLGLEPTVIEVGGQVGGSYVAADPTGLTSVSGVWVAGNVADPKAQVITSAAAGLVAGAAINADLIAAETHEAVERARQYGQAAWDKRYGDRPEGVWSGNPNPVLVAEITGLEPGRALDIGCGEGADALWLAEHGWQVTAVDISTVALARAEQHADSAGVKVDWVHADLLAELPAADSFELVSSNFMQLPETERKTLYGALADAVTVGGTLLLVGHHPSDLGTTAGRPHLPEMFFTAEQLAAELDPARWDVLVAEARPRPTADHAGQHITIHDTVLRARRRS